MLKCSYTSIYNISCVGLNTYTFFFIFAHCHFTYRPFFEIRIYFNNNQFGVCVKDVPGTCWIGCLLNTRSCEDAFNEDKFHAFTGIRTLFYGWSVPQHSHQTALTIPSFNTHPCLARFAIATYLSQHGRNGNHFTKILCLPSSFTPYFPCSIFPLLLY